MDFLIIFSFYKKNKILKNLHFFFNVGNFLSKMNTKNIKMTDNQKNKIGQ